MASIQFKVLDDANSLNTLSGSGLGFYGATFGASVSTTSYQDSTYVTSADGQNEGTSTRNVKYITPSSCYGGVNPTSGVLHRLNSSDATLTINFNHSSAVKVQNAQLRIFDRFNPDSPASGVITKVAEIFNFGGGNPNVTDWFATPGADFVAGTGCAGDAFWWGSQWPDSYMLSESVSSSVRPGYTNSVGVRFVNFTDYQYGSTSSSGNPHPNVSGLNTPGPETVGGSGIIVPLMDSPGPTGSFIATGIYDGSVSPKFAQYISPNSQVALVSGLVAGYDITNSATLSGTYGGTGYATDHTWYVALSARPLTIGSKTAYGLYLSLEYL